MSDEFEKYGDAVVYFIFSHFDTHLNFLIFKKYNTCTVLDADG